jgi:hypothetical protein
VARTGAQLARAQRLGSGGRELSVHRPRGGQRPGGQSYRDVYDSEREIKRKEVLQDFPVAPWPSTRSRSQTQDARRDHGAASAVAARLEVPSHVAYREGLAYKEASVIARIRTWWSERREAKSENTYRMAEKRRAEESAGPPRAGTPPTQPSSSEQGGTSTRLPNPP